MSERGLKQIAPGTPMDTPNCKASPATLMALITHNKLSTKCIHNASKLPRQPVGPDRSQKTSFEDKPRMVEKKVEEVKGEMHAWHMHG
jgi:hypothetical protein